MRSWILPQWELLWSVISVTGCRISKCRHLTGLLRELVIPSLNLAVISIVSFMMTVRSFAEKNGYAIDVDQELRAQGYINIASGYPGVRGQCRDQPYSCQRCHRW